MAERGYKGAWRGRIMSPLSDAVRLVINLALLSSSDW
jgi:hypothetical protein